MSNDWRARARRPDEALELIKSGMRVFVHGAAATPAPLLEALAPLTFLRVSHWCTNSKTTSSRSAVFT